MPFGWGDIGENSDSASFDDMIFSVLYQSKISNVDCLNKRY